MKSHPCLLGLLGLTLLIGAVHPAVAQTKITVPLLPTDSLAQRIPFQGVVAVPEVPAGELQARAREWIALTFADAQRVIQLDDAARGVIIGRGYTAEWVDRKLYSADMVKLLSFAFRLDFRAGRYRYEVFELGRPRAITSAGSSQSIISDQLQDITVDLGSSATAALSPRYSLFAPDTDPAHRAKSEKPASNFSQERAAFTLTMQRTVAGLLASLQQHVAAAPKQW